MRALTEDYCRSQLIKLLFFDEFGGRPSCLHKSSKAFCVFVSDRRRQTQSHLRSDTEGFRAATLRGKVTVF